MINVRTLRVADACVREREDARGARWRSATGCDTGSRHRDEREEEDYTEGCLHVWSAIAARDYRGLEGFRPMFIAPRGSEEFETEKVGVPRA